MRNHQTDCTSLAGDLPVWNSAQQTEHRRQLHEELESSSGDGAPGRPDGDARLIVWRTCVSAEDERGDDGGAPDHRRGVAEEEAVMAVEDADAEGGEDE